MKYAIALIISKIIYLILKITGKGATVFPGRIAIKICPDFLKYVKKPPLIIGVTGTNGKTTVSNIIGDALKDLNYKVISNVEGANINFGIASTFISSSGKYDVAVLEIDERSSKKIYPYIKPDYIVITNLFRDSTRRNAHPEFIIDIINSSIPKTSTLIVNADDLICSQIGPDNKKIYYSIEKLDGDTKVSNNIVRDIIICPNCYTKLEYEYVKYHHIGKAYCKNCDFKSSEPDYKAVNVDFENLKMTVKNKNKMSTYPMISNSIFNTYNELAVICVLSELKMKAVDIKNTISKIKIVETRFTTEKVNDIEIITHLAKGQNPIACSRVFDYVKSEKGNKEVIVMIDDVTDNLESSENMTWIYDTDFEFLNDDSIKRVILGGPRAYDNFLRILLTGIDRKKVFYTLDELDVVNYLNLKDIDKVFILHDLHAVDLGFKVKKKITNKILGGEINEN